MITSWLRGSASIRLWPVRTHSFGRSHARTVVDDLWALPVCRPRPQAGRRCASAAIPVRTGWCPPMRLPTVAVMPQRRGKYESTHASSCEPKRAIRLVATPKEVAALPPLAMVSIRTRRPPWAALAIRPRGASRIPTERCIRETVTRRTSRRNVQVVAVPVRTHLVPGQAMATTNVCYRHRENVPRIGRIYHHRRREHLR